MTARKPLLVQREASHGSFAAQAALAQELKRKFAMAPNYELLSFEQCESLDMIASKLARILVGDPDDPDHWRDVSGYADLVVETLKP